MHLGVLIQNVLDEARKQNRPAQQMVAWIQINKRGLRMCYAQDLERKCRTGSILFSRGDLFQLIKTVGGFEQHSILWDSPHNLQRMAEMQNEVLARRTQLGAINQLYGGLVTGQYATAGRIGTAGQPKKFYVPLPQLPTASALCR